MNDKNFEKMDQDWMSAAEDARDKKVSDGILKGFSASVERRVLGKERIPSRVRALSWAPAMVILVLASVAVFRTSSFNQVLGVNAPSVEYAQLNDMDYIDDEIAALKEVGAWTDADDALLGASDEAFMEDLELSDLGLSYTSIA